MVISSRAHPAAPKNLTKDSKHKTRRIFIFSLQNDKVWRRKLRRTPIGCRDILWFQIYYISINHGHARTIILSPCRRCQIPTQKSIGYTQTDGDSRPNLQSDSLSYPTEPLRNDNKLNRSNFKMIWNFNQPCSPTQWLNFICLDPCHTITIAKRPRVADKTRRSCAPRAAQTNRAK